MTYALWIVQGLLALLFLFTGGIKLVLPLEVLTEGSPLPGWFVRAIGVADTGHIKARHAIRGAPVGRSARGEA